MNSDPKQLSSDMAFASIFYNFKRHAFPVNIFGALVMIAATAVVYMYVQWRAGRRHLYKLAAKLPKSGLSSLPLIGNGHHFLADAETIMTNTTKACEVSPVTAIWLGPKFIVGISKPEDLEIAFNSQYTLAKYELYDMGKHVVGEGLLTAPVAKWRKNRKIILPTFHQKILDTFVEVFTRQSNIMVDQIGKTNGETFDISDMLGRCSLDIVCETVMGVKFNAQLSESIFAKNIARSLELVTFRIFNIFVHPDIIYKLTANYRESERITKQVNEMTEKVIREKKDAYHDKKREMRENPEVLDTPTRKGFLELLIELTDEGQKMSDRELRDEVATFLVAGIDTSATVSSFAYLVLAMHQDVQQRVYEETLEILGEERLIQPDDLPKFIYLERVIKETMRLFPPGPFVFRNVDADLKLTTHTVPKGCAICFATFVTHRSPLYYPDPLKFDPDRFLPEEVAKRHPYAYYPFTAGLRKCIGPKYGMMVMKVMISSVIRNFKLETDLKRIEDIRLKETLVLRTVDGYMVRATPRK